MEPRWHPPTFPTPRHERVHDLLRRLVSEGAAHFFADACEIAQRRPPFRSTTHLVGHLLREVEGQVLDVLTGLPGVPHELRGRQNVSDAHRKKVEAILVALDLVVVAGEWRGFVGSGGGWVRQAHRDELRAPRTPDGQFMDRVDTFVAVLAIVLDAAESRFAAVLRAIHPHLQASPPSSNDIEVVSRYLGTGVTALAHVFEHLDPTWLIPLRDRSVFSDPPDVRVHDGGSFSFPGWPQAEYLARIATVMPSEVASTILTVPVVNNESVHLAFLEAGARMPPAEAARVARHEAQWLGSHPWANGLLPRAVQALLARLFQGNEIETALLLLRASLTLLPDDADRRRRERVARFDSWQYREFAGKMIPDLARLAPTATRDLLFELIDAGASAQSSFSLRHVDDDEDPGIDEPLDILFVQLRDLYVSRAAAGTPKLRAAVAELDAKHIPLYDRLALHILRLHGEAAPDLVVERATDPNRLSAGDGDDEMTLMIRDRFAGLPPTDKERVLEAIRTSTSEATVRGHFGSKLDDKTLSSVARHRLLKWLHVLGPARPAGLDPEHAALLAEFGEPEPPSTGVMYGPNPPRSAAELLALTDAELLAYLRDWVPTSTDPFEPSREGLAREIKACVAGSVERFARLARDFRGLAPTYVSNLLWGIHDVTKVRSADASKPVALPAIDWDAVLDLLEWTVAQPTTSDAEDASGNWTWARRIAVDVAEDVAAAMAALDHVRTKRASEVVRSLMKDADPTAERDADHGDDLDTFAINTVRGQALHAALRVAATLRAEPSGPAGLLTAVMSEVALRADSSVEPSLAVRSVLALRFNALYNLDPSAARSVATVLLPTQPERSPERRAAWHSFIERNNASGPTFKILQEPYAVAIDDLATEDPKIAGRLGIHLAWLAMWGVIDESAEGNPLRAFVDKAPITARHDALRDLGFSLYHTTQTIPDERLSRLRALLEWWTGVVTAQRSADDLAAFGWWFASKHFDAEWSLSILERVLIATDSKLDLDDQVAEKLASYASAFPDQVAACLGRFIDGADTWRALRSKKHIRASLEAIIATPAVAAARAIASRLVARRWLDFQDLA